VRLASVYVNHWSLRDPLCQSQSLPVLRHLAALGYPMGLVTFEQAAWRLPAADEDRERATLREAGIEWSPLPYHRRPPVLSTLFDIGRGAARCAALVRSTGARLVHARATVPAAIGRLASRRARVAFLDDADGPLSEEYADAGIWRRGSLLHRAVAAVERHCLRTADAVAVLSELRRQDLAGVVEGPIEVLPCGVDTRHFARRPEARQRIRRELGLRERVLVYAGKWGGWYLGDVVLDLARTVEAVWGPLSLLILTPEPPQRFSSGAAARGLDCRVLRATRDEMPEYLSAADAGLSFRMDSVSQRACSPIKNGEYLACGLPLVTTPGAGDYPGLALRERVGVVLEGTSPDALDRAAAALAGLLSEPGLASRCREVACREVGLSEVVLPRYERLYGRLLGPPRA
jgi:glycosyltransferase involved in cell wall biosynthesis